MVNIGHSWFKKIANHNFSYVMMIQNSDWSGIQLIGSYLVWDWAGFQTASANGIHFRMVLDGIGIL